MPVNITRGRDSRPIDLRLAHLELVRKLPGRFRDGLQGTDDGVHGLGIRDKAAISQAARKFSDQVNIFEDVPSL